MYNLRKSVDGKADNNETNTNKTKLIHTLVGHGFVLKSEQ
jgi:hypothetical protein